MKRFCWKLCMYCNCWFHGSLSSWNKFEKVCKQWINWQRMQKTSGVISALCYLIPIVVAEWLKILHLFLATVFLGSRKVLFSSFYGNGDRGVKNHFCSSSRKPLWLHRDVWKTATLLLFTCWLGLGLAGWTCQCACSGGGGQALSTEVLLLWQESEQGSTARQHPTVPAVLALQEQQIRGQGMWAALRTKGQPLSHKHDLFICIQQNTTTMKQKGANLPNKKKHSSSVCCKQTAAGSLPGNTLGQCNSGKCFLKSLNST